MESGKGKEKVNKKYYLNRVHNLVTRAHDLVTRVHDLVSRTHEVSRIFVFTFCSCPLQGPVSSQHISKQALNLRISI